MMETLISYDHHEVIVKRRQAVPHLQKLQLDGCEEDRELTLVLERAKGARGEAKEVAMNMLRLIVQKHTGRVFVLLLQERECDPARPLLGTVEVIGMALRVTYPNDERVLSPSEICNIVLRADSRSARP